jgi:hypothetical protein
MDQAAPYSKIVTVVLVSYGIRKNGRIQLETCCGSSGLSEAGDYISNGSLLITTIE